MNLLYLHIFNIVVLLFAATVTT